MLLLQIDTLLNHPLPVVQALGAELLASYIEAQVTTVGGREGKNMPLSETA